MCECADGEVTSCKTAVKSNGFPDARQRDNQGKKKNCSACAIELPNVQECDAREVDSSSKAGYIKMPE